MAARFALSSSANSSFVFFCAKYARTRFTTRSATANAKTAQYSLCMSLMGSLSRSPDNTARSHGNMIPASGFAGSGSGSGVERLCFVSAAPRALPSIPEPPASAAASADADASAFAPDPARDALGPSPPGPFALAHARAPAANPRCADRGANANDGGAESPPAAAKGAARHAIAPRGVTAASSATHAWRAETRVARRRDACLTGDMVRGRAGASGARDLDR